MKAIIRVGVVLLFQSLAVMVAAVTWQQPTQQASPQKKEVDASRIFDRWLKEDVAYIITEPERAVFQSLSTFEEKERFIEQFWLRRDPTPGTMQNEFREEHYRRIQYANERFAAGRPGWMTDRGRIYVKYGEPYSMERRPSGGSYIRPQSEGGGTTTVFPFEIWRYHYIEGLGPEVEIEFVDETRTGNYRIALSPQQKDALLYVPGAGKTEFEEMGLEDRWKRITREGLATTYVGPTKDLPFERMARLVGTTRPPEFKFNDLRTLVTTHVTYNQLPLIVGTHYLRLGEDRALVSVAMEVPNSSLRYQKNETIYRSELQIYGRVTDVTGKLFQEFEDTVQSEHNEERRQQALAQKSLYQKLLTLKAGTYKLELVIRDPESKLVGTAQERIAIPQTYPPGLACSPVLLASRIELASGAAGGGLERFAVGDLKVLPNVSATFAQGDILGVYLHVYGAALDQANSQLSLSVRYHILQNGRMVRPPLVDDEGRSVNFVSDRRAVLVYGIATESLQPGSYRLLIRIKDKVGGQETTADASFSVAK